MKATFPHMGTLEFIIKDLLTRLEVDFIVSPRTTTRALKLGSKYGPEFACLPLKVTIGNLIEGIEAGADTLIMVGGIGPCRFGYYADIQRRLIAEAGYDFEMVTLEPVSAGVLRFINTFRYLAPKKKVRKIWQSIKTSFLKAQAFDEVERDCLRVRGLEEILGSTNEAKKQAFSLLDKAVSREEIERARAMALDLIRSVKQNREKQYLKVGLVGEFYLLLEPFSNFDLEELLGQMGVYLEKAVYLSDWIGPSPKNPVQGLSKEEMVSAAAPYLVHQVGGEGIATIGHVVDFKQRGFDGAIHLLPFTCMPEIIAKSILPKVSRELDMPVLTLVIDEQTGKAGVVTRVEAFLDLLWARKNITARRSN